MNKQLLMTVLFVMALDVLNTFQNALFLFKNFEIKIKLAYAYINTNLFSEHEGVRNYIQMDFSMMHCYIHTRNHNLEANLLTP